MQRRTLLPGLLLAALLIAPRAHGAVSPEDAALADSLYAEGGKLMEAGRFAEGCPKIEASLKLDPGIGSSLRLGYCWEKVGRSASAWSMYNLSESLARAAGDKRADQAAKQAKQLEPLLSRLVLDVAPENQAGGVEIKRDGKVIDPAAWTSAIPLDPGLHVLEASGPARAPWKTTVTIAAKPGITTVRVPKLEDGPTAGSSASDLPPSLWTTPRIVAVAAGGGLGAIGVAVGSAFGVRAIGKYSDSKLHCQANQPNLCSAEGVSLRQETKTAMTISTATFGVGVAALAGGVVLFLTTGPKDAKSGAAAVLDVMPAAAGADAGLTLRARW